MFSLLFCSLAQDWLKAIKALTDSRAVGNIDIFVLLILHDLPAFKVRQVGFCTASTVDHLL